MITEIMMLIDTVALFFQGFFFGRKNSFGILIASLVILSIAALSMIFKGIYIFSDAILNVNILDFILGLAYVLFWWILGYISSGFTLIRENDKKVLIIKKIKAR